MATQEVIEDQEKAGVAFRKMGNGNDRASSDGKPQRHEKYGRCAWRKAIAL